MEGLTKQQLVLLALLVSFVTSIATGIVTVSLLERAPKAVTQTINRIVERTVERVVPAENQKAAVITKETVVVRADDLAVAAIEQNAQSLVRVKRVEGAGDRRTETLVGLGVVVSKDGLVAADAGAAARRFDEYGTPIPRSFLGILAGGAVAELQFVGVDETGGIVLFAMKPVGEDKLNISPVSFGDSDTLKLGQTVISLGGAADNAVGTGIVANLARKNAPTQEVLAVYTDREAASDLSGTLLLNLSGEVVGINAGPFRAERSRYLPVNLLKESIDALQAQKQ